MDAERESAPAYGVPAKYRNEVRTLCGEKERARKGKVKAAHMSGFCNVRRVPRRGSVLRRTRASTAEALTKLFARSYPYTLKGVIWMKSKEEPRLTDAPRTPRT